MPFDDDRGDWSTNREFVRTILLPVVVLRPNCLV